MERKGNDALDGLLTSAKEGDEVAFEELVNLYKPMINGAISRFSLDPRDAFSEACIGFFRAVTTYDTEQGNTTFGLYAKICVERCLIDLQRREANRTSHYIDNGVDVDKIAVSGGVQSILEHREQTAHLLAVAREVLSDLELDVYRYWMLGYTTSEIAAMRGVSSKTVDNAKNRMWSKLRKRLSSEY